MLLQGPPGTGKTFTLIAIASGIYNYLKIMLILHKFKIKPKNLIIYKKMHNKPIIILFKNN